MCLGTNIKRERDLACIKGKGCWYIYCFHLCERIIATDDYHNLVIVDRGICYILKA